MLIVNALYSTSLARVYALAIVRMPFSVCLSVA